MPTTTSARRTATDAARIERPPSERGIIPEHEADAANRVDQRRLPELAAEVGDVPVDDVQARRRRPAPHELDRLRAADDLTRVAQEQLEQVGLAPAQRELDAAAPRRPRLDLEHEVAEREHLRRRRSASEQRAHTREQLLGRERLHEVVVGARVQARDAVLDSVARGQKQDRQRKPLGPQAPAHREPVEPGQADVEHDEVRRPTARPRRARRRRLRRRTTP